MRGQRACCGVLQAAGVLSAEGWSGLGPTLYLCVHTEANFFLERRYGVWGDWERPYLTLEPKYEAAQLRVFGKLVAAGHIYRGRKPVYSMPTFTAASAKRLALLEDQNNLMVSAVDARVENTPYIA